MSATQSLSQLLAQPVKTICRPDIKLTTVDAAEDPAHAFGRLVEANVLSAPCKLPSGWRGYLDMRDLVSYVVFLSKLDQPTTHIETEAEKLAHFKERRSRYLRATLKVLFDNHGNRSADPTAPAQMHRDVTDGITTSYLAGRHMLATVDQEASLAKVAELLRTNKFVAVFDSLAGGNLVDVISQSMFVAFLYKNSEKLSPLLSSLTVKAASNSPVVCIKSTATALEAFQMMDKHNLRGLGVVDAEGKIIAATSARDLKLVLSDLQTEMLKWPIIEYLKKIRQADLRDRPPVIVVQPEDTLKTAIGKLAATKLHRVFITENGAPSSVLSLTDVIRALPRLDTPVVAA